MRIWMVIIAATAMVGCSKTPGSPTPLSSTLAISAFQVRPLELNGRHVYRPTLILSETSLKDAATLIDIVLSVPDGGSFSIIVKGGTPIRIPAGQTWDLNQSPYYPAFVDIDSGSEIAEVRATVSFVDGVGGTGSVTSTATVTK